MGDEEGGFTGRRQAGRRSYSLGYSKKFEFYVNYVEMPPEGS